MLDILTAFEALFPRSSPEPAVAAAVTVLANSIPPPPSPNRLDPALRAVAPHLTDDQRATWVATLAEPLLKAGIITPRCVAAFLGQCAVESGGFRSLEEDLSYSATRLCQVWPSRFPSAKAAEACALQPELLANRVYSSRMGNEDEASGDGWRFRGRGLIQISGRSAYTRFAQAIGMTLDQAVEHAATRAGAADSATWFWSANQLNALAKTWSIDLITRKINGGTTGAAERTRLCEAALHAIGA
ncbi:MAG: putative chitinase [Acetobacteraceae bacterium]|jgi:putative chitinase|nr:putative chitinase [Acetobacteraceae bacterium]